MIKPGIRSIGIDDGPFRRESRGNVIVAGAVYQGGSCFDGLLTTTIRKDGWNATERVSRMITGSKFWQQLHYILLDGIALGGFNLIDIERLHTDTGLKILVVIRRRPNLVAIEKAIQNLTLPERRMEILQRAGEIQKIGRLYCQLKGMGRGEAEELLKLTCTRSLIPEPLRAAHLITGGLIRGQSGKRA